MQDQSQNSLFEIKLNETGILYIRKFFRLTGIVFISVIVTSLFSIFFEFSSFITTRRFSGASLPLLYLIRISVYVITIAGNVWAGYYYFRLSRLLHRSIDMNDEASFNLSFRSVYRNAAILAVITVMNVLLDILILLNVLWMVL